MKKILICLAFFLFVSSTCIAPPLTKANSDYLIKEYIYQKEQKIKQQEFKQFLELLAYKESRGNWRVYNKYGYIGKWQMGKAALKATGFGYITFSEFKTNPNIFPENLQEIAVCKLISLNLLRLTETILAYEGKIVGDVLITKSGIIAAAHLGGVRGVEMYLNSDGHINKRDVFGTSILDYLKEFSMFKF